MKAKYINPFTGFGFKKFFGKEASEPLLIDFFDCAFAFAKPDCSFSFKNTEQLE